MLSVTINDNRAPRTRHRRSTQHWAFPAWNTWRADFTYVDQSRAGDHICCYSDLRKMKAHYPKWNITQSLEETIRQIVEAWKVRNKPA